ncbi:MAG TPA: hypothetical protein VGL53_23930 [Bryobacteraceae bacterium]|jgi:hypothetical protein
MMRGFYDGSGPGHPNGRYVIAGFVAPAEQWDRIAEDWDIILKLPPAIPKFKLSLSRNPAWRDQHGITVEQLDSKIQALKEIVAPPATHFSVVASINEGAFKDSITRHGLQGDKLAKFIHGSSYLRSPYGVLFSQAVALTLMRADGDGYNGKIDLIFDRENKLFDDASKMIRFMREYRTNELLDMIGGISQADEDEVLPLQAADLVAGLAKDCLNNPHDLEAHRSAVEILGSSNEGAFMGEEEIDRYIQRMKQISNSYKEEKARHEDGD